MFKVEEEQQQQQKIKNTLSNKKSYNN